jgi:hypothetical protein
MAEVVLRTLRVPLICINPAGEAVVSLSIALPRRLHCKGRRRAPPAACRARGGDPRGRPCGHTHEPWRSGGSRRPSLKGPFLPQ